MAGEVPRKRGRNFASGTSPTRREPFRPRNGRSDRSCADRAPWRTAGCGLVYARHRGSREKDRNVREKEIYETWSIDAGGFMDGVHFQSIHADRGGILRGERAACRIFAVAFRGPPRVGIFHQKAGAFRRVSDPCVACDGRGNAYEASMASCCRLGLRSSRGALRRVYRTSADGGARSAIHRRADRQRGGAYRRYRSGFHSHCFATAPKKRVLTKSLLLLPLFPADEAVNIVEEKR